MYLTFDNFVSEIEPEILKRGWDYFQAGYVVDLEKLDEGEWSARVRGTSMYRVEIHSDSEGRLLCDCDCPYDWSPYCKHIAAVLYAIQQGNVDDHTLDEGYAPHSNSTLSSKMRCVLGQVSREDLVEMLVGVAQQDRQFANRLLLRYSDEATNVKAYSRMVQDALATGYNRHGFIDYDGARQAADAIAGLLGQARHWWNDGKSTQAIALMLTVMELSMTALGHADDSGGSLGGCVDSACCFLQSITGKLDGDERRKLFDYCIENATKKPYRDWHWGWSLAEMAADLAVAEIDRRQVFDLLDRMVGTSGENDGVAKSYARSSYEQERAAHIKLSLIERCDGASAALAFITEQVHLHSFRQMLIEHNLKRGDLAEVKRLCNEWLNTYRDRSPGYEATYLGILLNVARQEKADDEAIRLARLLFIKTADFNLYELLKQMIPSESWPDYLESLIRDVRTSRSPWIEPDILVRESMWKRLFLFINGQENKKTLLNRYASYLEPHFPTEIFEFYKEVVFDMLKQTTGRGVYAEAANYLLRMKRLAGKERVDEIIDLLVSTYRNRRAMIDELNKARHA